MRPPDGTRQPRSAVVGDRRRSGAVEGDGQRVGVVEKDDQWTGAGAENGSGTVLVLGVIAVLLALAIGLTGLVQVQAAVGRARLAADLAALGGATALSSVVAPADPCAVAQTVAGANGAQVETCHAEGEDVVVRVGVTTTVLGVPRSAHSAARAGPVDSGGALAQ